MKILIKKKLIIPKGNSRNSRIRSPDRNWTTTFLVLKIFMEIFFIILEIDFNVSMNKWNIWSCENGTKKIFPLFDYSLKPILPKPFYLTIPPSGSNLPCPLNSCHSVLMIALKLFMRHAKIKYSYKTQCHR